MVLGRVQRYVRVANIMAKPRGMMHHGLDVRRLKCRDQLVVALGNGPWQKAVSNYRLLAELGDGLIVILRKGDKGRWPVAIGVQEMPGPLRWVTVLSVICGHGFGNNL